MDFVCNFGSKRYYIQCAYSLDSNEKIIQKNSLTNINDSFKRIIIVNDNSIARYDDEIKIMNLKEFLIDINSLDKLQFI